MKYLLFFSFFFFAFSGCDPASNETGCTDDSDCRFDRQCVQNVCLGDVDLVIPPNNGVSNNGYSNNGYSNNGYYSNNGFYTNNGYTNNGYYSNNGYYTNNGYTNNGYYTNNQTLTFCEIGPDCGVDDACSRGVCTDAEDAEVTRNEALPGDCAFYWERGPGQVNGYAEYSCMRRQNVEYYECFCLAQGPNEGASSMFQGGANACEDYDQIEQDMNDYCGTRFRNTFAP